MAQVKTSDLNGKALDWAVSKVIGEYKPVPVPEYSTSWEHAGPVIEREEIAVLPPIVRRIDIDGFPFTVDYWRARMQKDEIQQVTLGKGDTPLIAAMRCYVSSKLGDVVTIPDELM